jgi:hypothetical protein
MISDQPIDEIKVILCQLNGLTGQTRRPHTSREKRRHI